MIEGVSVAITRGNVQAAIDAAGAAYRRKNGIPPTHVCLPGAIATESLELYTLRLGPPTSLGRTHTRHAGTVLVGRRISETVVGAQLELL